MSEAPLYSDRPHLTGVPRSSETPTPLGSPQVSRHRATVGSYGGGVLISEVPLYVVEFLQPPPRVLPAGMRANRGEYL